MIKLIKLIYINILSFFDINRVLVNRKKGVKDVSETRLIFYFIMALGIGYFLYNMFVGFEFDNKYNILLISYFLSTVVCFISNLMIVGNVIFKSDDNELLFTLPVARDYVIFSKLFNVYVKNIIFVFVIMFSGILAFSKFFEVSQTMVMVYIVCSLLIPCFPIVLSGIIVYFDNYYKVKVGRIYKLIRNILLVFVLILFSCIFNTVDISFLGDNLVYLYPLNLLFIKSVCDYNIFCFLILVLLSLLAFCIYSLCINNNYLKITSVLKGVRKKLPFVYKKRFRFGRLFGFVRKEILNIFNNRIYLLGAFGFSFSFTLVLLVLVLFVDDLNSLIDMNFINFYLPSLLGMVASMGNITISSISIEKENRDMIGSMPISFGYILFSKWFANILLGSLFVLINGTLVWYGLSLDKYMVLMVYVFPLISLMFTSLICLLLDILFIMKNEKDENVILKQRAIAFGPSVISMLIGFIPFLIKGYLKYKYLHWSYILIMLVFMFIILMYIIILRKKLYQKMFY